jgi:hypothetical protein
VNRLNVLNRFKILFESPPRHCVARACLSAPRRRPTSLSLSLSLPHPAADTGSPISLGPARQPPAPCRSCPPPSLFVWQRCRLRPMARGHCRPPRTVDHRARAPPPLFPPLPRGCAHRAPPPLFPSLPHAIESLEKSSAAAPFHFLPHFPLVYARAPVSSATFPSIPWSNSSAGSRRLAIEIGRSAAADPPSR